MNESERAKRKLSIFSLATSIFLVIVKTIVAYTSNSLGVYSEALNNSLDIVTVLITFLAIRVSIKPADKDHPYGHGKYENFSAFLETIIISLLSVYIIYKSIARIVTKDYALNINIYVFIVLIFSIFINIIRVIYIRNIALKYNSPAFKADLINYSGDILSSVIVIGGLIFAKYGLNIADPIASIIISLIILFFSGRLALKTVKDLLGYIPAKLTDLIEGILNNFEEIQKIDKIRIQEVGNIKFVNIQLSLKSSLHLSQVELIKEKIKNKLSEELADSEISIETKSSLYDSNLNDLIKEIILNESKVKDIHNVLISNIEGKLNITIHLELEKELKLIEAEEITKNIEEKIKKTAPEIERIYIHIEVENHPEDWDDITEKSETLIEEIKDCIKNQIDTDTCHKFTVLFNGDKYNISFHCRFNRELEIKKVHLKTTEMENIIKTALSDINELTIHAEPEKDY
jgi:cation diffusion facilitator family transporter